MKDHRLTPEASLRGMQLQALSDHVVCDVAGGRGEISTWPIAPPPVALAQVGALYLDAAG